MTSRTRDQGTKRRVEAPTLGRLFLQRMHKYRVLAEGTELKMTMERIRF